ncbi:MAG: biotin transporter BioY [Alphaproteobacteria bacterium]|nr:biotin transporter BioY [Alphaproteobacteria bacterium]
MSTLAVPAPVLADRLVPDVRWRDAALVVGGALLVALLAQLRVYLPFTPVPITGQTLGVALVGAGLGARRGALSMGLYVGLGALGLPFYAGGEGGLSFVFGATGGYLLGFVAAAALVGRLAERQADRRPLTAFISLQAGSLVIFAFGLAGLMLTTGVGFEQAIAQGWLPFIPGDLFKTALAAGLLPGAWALIERFTGR